MAEHCGADLAVTALTGEGHAAARRAAVSAAGQLVVTTPGRIAQVRALALMKPCQRQANSVTAEIALVCCKEVREHEKSQAEILVRDAAACLCSCVSAHHR